MSLNKIPMKLVFVVLSVLAVAVINLHRASGFEYADFDGFQYLSFSKSVVFGTDVYKDPIRSPILAFLIPPDLMLARIEMIFLHLANVALIFAIVKKVTNNENAALFSAFLYGINWWMITFLVGTLSDLPAMTFFLASFLFWLNGDRKSMIYSGILAGLAFIVRFDAILLLLPLVAFTAAKKFRKEFFVPFLVLILPFELFTSWAVFGKLVYPPLEFLKVNFFYGLAPSLAVNSGLLSMVGKIFELSPLLVILSVLSLFQVNDQNYRKILLISLFAFVTLTILPIPDNRIFMVKLVPFMSMLAGYALLPFADKMGKPLNTALILFVLMAYTVYNLGLAFSIDYPDWRLSGTPCEYDNICTNAVPVVNYYCGENAVDIHQAGGRHVNTDPSLNKTYTIFSNLAKCDYLVYYNVSFGYEDRLNELIKSKYPLSEAKEFALVYDLR